MNDQQLNRLQKTLPPSTATSRGIEDILRACGVQLEELEQEARMACRRLTASLVDEKGAALWERNLGLEVREDLGLDGRKVLIQVALDQMETCTPARLLAFLGRMLEGDNRLREDFPAYWIYLTAQVAHFWIPSLRLVEKALRRAVPAHLGMTLKALTDGKTNPQPRRGLTPGIGMEIYTTEEEPI